MLWDVRSKIADVRRAGVRFLSGCSVNRILHRIDGREVKSGAGGDAGVDDPRHGVRLVILGALLYR